MARIWIDYKNSHEPAFFRPFIRQLSQHSFIYTARNYAEITDLLKYEGIDAQILGKHSGSSMIGKTLGMIFRDLELALNVPSFDISLTHASGYAVHAARLKRKKTIVFTDNDLVQSVYKILLPFVNYLVVPKALDIEILRSQGAKKAKVFTYDGVKEDIYAADFEPDPNFLDNLPFSDFVAIRGEAFQASYVPKGSVSLVPALLTAFAKEGINVLFLPRYPEERKMYADYENVFMPPKPLKGMDICWYSKVLLTGSGTFAREAAVIGTPAVEFHSIKSFAVDHILVEQDRLFISRDVGEIMDYVRSCEKKEPDLARSRKVQAEVMDIVRQILDMEGYGDGSGK